MDDEYNSAVSVSPYDCHDERNEPRPDSVVYQPVFFELKEHIKQVATLLREPLQASSYHNAITRGLLKEVQTRTEERLEEKVMFAVAGDMSSGKSSVINSLLSIGMIARKGDEGGSCTWVVQRFMKPFPDQKGPYAAKVLFFSNEEIRDIIAALLLKWWRASGRDKDDADSTDGQDHVEKYSDITTVTDSLSALFADREGFDTAESANEYLSQAASEDDMLDQLSTWAQDAVATRLQSDNIVTLNASTVENLLLVLQPFTYTLPGTEGDGQVALWPLVSVIDFGLDHPLLNEGIILVDSPGTSDANTTRAANAIRHHRICTHKITVANVDRAKDDKSLRESLYLGFRTRGSGNSVLVLTNGDSLDGCSSVVGSPHEKAQERKLKVEIQDLKDQKIKLRIKKSEASRDDKHDVDAELDAVGARLASTTCEYEGNRMNMRNRATVKKVREQYRALTKEIKPLCAFVVGNQAYETYQAGFAAEERPALTVEQTGIPALRQRIYLLPAEGKINDVLHIATVQLPSLITSFELFCSKTHMARKNEIEEIVLQSKKRLRTILIETYDKLKHELDVKMLNHMKTDDPKWTSAARKLCTVWARQHTKEHLRLLQKNGFKKGTKNTGWLDIDWNTQLMKIHREHMDRYIRDFVSAAQVVVVEDTAKAIGNMMDATRTQIRGDRQFSLMALEPFLKTFQQERPNAMRAVKVQYKRLQRDMSSVAEDALATSPSAYLVQAMAPIYAVIHPLRGPGAVDLRKQTFSREVSKLGGVWMQVHDGIEQSMHAHIVRHLDHLDDELNTIFDGIHAKFNLVCDDTVVKDEGEKRLEEQLRTKLAKNLILAKEMMDGPIREAAETCKGYSKQKAESSLFVLEE
ncbi:hypothetical protein LTR08_001123 [Meristemomyces frigidus]|nr:hypothetical protein LTR08_001123 [Meristemomyces frigidus]